VIYLVGLVAKKNQTWYGEQNKTR